MFDTPKIPACTKFEMASTPTGHPLGFATPILTITGAPVRARAPVQLACGLWQAKMDGPFNDGWSLLRKIYGEMDWGGKRMEEMCWSCTSGIGNHFTSLWFLLKIFKGPDSND